MLVFFKFVCHSDYMFRPQLGHHQGPKHVVTMTNKLKKQTYTSCVLTVNSNHNYIFQTQRG